MALGVLAALAANFALMAQLSLRLTGMRWSELGAAHLPALALTVVLGAETWALAGWLRGQQTAPLVLLAEAALFSSGAGALLCWVLPPLFLGRDARPLLRALMALVPAWARLAGRPSAVMEEGMTELLDQDILSRRSAQDAGPGGLAVVRGLLARLHEADLAYCHWKSNEHLEAAIEGLTDLDILVDRRRDGELRRILADSGFKRFVAPPLRAYPGIEDYLALDRDTGRLVHLHLHHRLTLGERHLKGYRLPWEARLLATRRLDPATGVYVADPAIELVLLLVRAALKQRARDRARRLAPRQRRASRRRFRARARLAAGACRRPDRARDRLRPARRGSGRGAAAPAGGAVGAGPHGRLRGDGPPSPAMPPNLRPARGKGARLAARAAVAG